MRQQNDHTSLASKANAVCETQKNTTYNRIILLTTKTNVPRNSARNSLSIPCLRAQCCLMLLVLCPVLPVAVKKVREAEQREALKFRALTSNLHLQPNAAIQHGSLIHWCNRHGPPQHHRHTKCHRRGRAEGSPVCLVSSVGLKFKSDVGFREASQTVS